MVKLFNTLTKQVDDLGPTERPLKMFVCGPTVYDFVGIHNTRTFVSFDAIVKYLRHRGYDVFYLQNVTDIDDKIIRRAQEQGTPALEFAEMQTQQFLADAKAIG